MPKKNNKKVITKEDIDDNDDNIDNDDIEENEIDEIGENDIDEIDLDNEDDDLEFKKDDFDTETVEDIIEDKYYDFEDSNLDIDDNYEIKSVTKDYLIGENRVSVNRLTKYEMVRILGERIKQLTMGAKPLVKNFTGLSYEKIAEEEFKLNMIPFKIIRTLPNGNQEMWTLDELYKKHLYLQLDEN